MTPEIALVGITAVAAVVNGALGHGFSSITVPLALVFWTSRVLNPALVLVEVGINAYVLLVSLPSVGSVWRRVLPLVIGVVPGVLVGTVVLSRVDPQDLKLGVFAALLPLILLQAAGVRRSLRAEWRAGVPLGAGVGVLYAVTTISGPPLALLLTNQGLAKRDFRAALALVRLVESTLTAVAYAAAGLYTAESAALLAAIAPGVLVGVPTGALLVQQLPAETFRRVCMSFDAWIVGFGLSRVLSAQCPGAWLLGDGLWAAVILIDAMLLVRFFRARVGPARPAVAGTLGGTVEAAG